MRAQIASLSEKRPTAEPFIRILNCIHAKRKEGTGIHLETRLFASLCFDNSEGPHLILLGCRSSKELEDLRERVLRLAFIHTEIIFEIFNTVSQQRLLSTPRVQRAADLVEYLFGFEAASDLQPLHYAAGRLVLSGCISKKSSGQLTKGFQYLYINRRYVSNTPLHRTLDVRFADILAVSASNARIRPSFILDLDCPSSEYDVTFEPTKSYVEFKDWSTIITFFQKALDEVWGPVCSALAGHSGTRLRCPSPPCALYEDERVSGLDMEEDPLTTCFTDSAPPPMRQNDELWRSNLLLDSEASPTNSDPYESIPQNLFGHPLTLRGPVTADITLDGPTEKEQSVAFAFEEVNIHPEHAVQADWEAPNQAFDPFQVTQPLHPSGFRRPGSGLELGVANERRTLFTPLPSFSELDYVQDCSHFGPAVHPAKHTSFEVLSSRASMRDSTPMEERFEPQWNNSEPGRRYRIDAKSQRDASSGTESKGRKADQSKIESALRIRSAQDTELHRVEDPPDTHFLQQAGTGRRKAVRDRVWTAASGRRKRRREESLLLPRRPQSAPPFARPKKRYGPESGASLEPSKHKDDMAGPRFPPEAASLTKWRTSEHGEVQKLYKAWQNPCFRAADSDVLEVETDRHPNIVPEKITSEMLQRLRVFQQLDRKFIAAVAGDTVVIIDQHAADERVRLEELKELVLGGRDAETTSSKSFREAIKLALTPADEQVLRTHKRVIEQWGWNFTFERLPQSAGIWNKAPGHSGQVLLTAVPQILGATLTATDLLEYIQQLQDTRSTSSVPPSIIRLLNSKACRGAIMFGDSLLPGECLQLLRHLQRTQLPFQCAHGRPTMVPLINMSVFASTYAAPDAEARDARSFQRERGPMRISKTRESQVSETASRSSAARGLVPRTVSLSRAKNRLQRAEK